MSSSAPFPLFAGHSSSFLISNITNLISVKLDNHNYLLWKSQFLPVLRAHGLLGFVDGSCCCPPEFMIDSIGNVTKDINPHYITWIQQDQNILCWINATLTERVLAHIVGLKTSRAVWVALEKRFASLSRSHIIQLKTQLQSIKKGSQPISEYVQRIKHLVDSLAMALCLMDDEDLLIHTLNGLPSKNGPFKTSIRTRSSPTSLEELHALLLCEEMSIATSQSSVLDHSTAFISSTDIGSSSAVTGKSGYNIELWKWKVW